MSPEKKKTRGAPRTIPRMWKFVTTAQMPMPFHLTNRSFCPSDEDLYGLHTLYKHIPTCRKYRRKCSFCFCNFKLSREIQSNHKSVSPLLTLLRTLRDPEGHPRYHMGIHLPSKGPLNMSSSKPSTLSFWLVK